MTDLIVLAAGLGRRLAEHSPLPKWLTEVGDETPARQHLGAAEAAGIERCLVVVSDPAGPIAVEVAAWRGSLVVAVIGNEHAAARNNWYSLLLGLQEWTRGAGTDVAVVNSDLFASVPWFASLLGSIAAAEAPAALAVDEERLLTDEAMKVELAGTGLLASIGKVGIDRPRGEYVGLAWWSRAAALELIEVLAEFCHDPARADHWYEHGIQVHVDRGGSYASVPVPSPAWVEIDDSADLAAARRLAASTTGANP